jgi:hypothetical protein
LLALIQGLGSRGGLVGVYQVLLVSKGQHGGELKLKFLMH